MKKRKFRQLIEDAFNYTFHQYGGVCKINPNATIGLFKSQEEEDKWLDDLEKTASNSEAVQALLAFMLHPLQQEEMRRNS